MFSLLTLLPQDDFVAWGWRIAFLSTIVLVAIGLYVRFKIEETPAFQAIKEAQAEKKVPFVTLLKTQPKQLLQGMGIRWIEGLTFNAYAVVAITYAVGSVGASRNVVLNGIVIGAAVGAVCTLLYGHLSDRFGRKRVYGVGVVCIAAFIFPSFALMGTGETVWIWISIAVGLGVIYSAIYGPLAAFWAELFDTEVRYTGVGAVYQFSGIYASGLTPLIGAALIDATGGKPWAFAGYMVVVAAISFAVLLTIPETYKRELIPTTINTEQTSPIRQGDSSRAY
jgi:MFS family permease